MVNIKFRNLFLVASFLLTAPLVSQAGQSSYANQYTIKEAKNKIEAFTDEIDLSLVEFFQASGKWQRLKSGKAKHQLTLLSDFYELGELNYYIEAELEPPQALRESVIQILNSQKSDLASYLGIDVYKLERFIQLYELAEAKEKRELANQQKSNSQLAYTAKSPTERIIVRCRDFCNSGYDWSGNLLSLVIWSNASATGIGQYTSFNVEFRDYHTNDSFKKEQWMYNNFSGAWFEEKAACSTCDPF